MNELTKPTAESDNSTRQAILDEALKLFSEVGFENASMRTLAREVGINPATLYHHFRDKKSIYEEILKNVYIRFAERFIEVLEDKSSNEVKFRSYVTEFCFFASRNINFLKLIKRSQLDGDQNHMNVLGGPVVAHQSKLFQELMKAIRPDLDPILAMSTLHGAILHHYETKTFNEVYHADWQPAHAEPAAVADFILSLFLRP